MPICGPMTTYASVYASVCVHGKPIPLAIFQGNAVQALGLPNSCCTDPAAYA